MRLALGTAQFGFKYGITNRKGRIDIKEINQIMTLAKSNGINHFDTAQEYGDSEKILGIYSEKQGFKVTTKLSTLDMESFNAENIKICQDKFETSLNNLKTNCIDTLLIHNPSDFKKSGNKNFTNWLNELKHSKLVNKIGVSIYNIDDLKGIEREFLDVVQLPLSLYNQEFLNNSILGNLKKLNCNIQARSIFLQGLLITPSEKWPKGININLKKHHLNLEKFIRTKNISLLELALKFVMSIKELDSIIVGINSANDLEEILESYNKNISISFEEIVAWRYEKSKHLDPRYWNT